MADELSVEEVADAMYDMVKGAMGQKKLKPMDLHKAMISQFGDDRCNKKLCKSFQLIRFILIVVFLLSQEKEWLY